MNQNASAPLLSDGCLDTVLLNDWHVVATSAEITPGNLIPTTLLERDLVCWREANGQLHVWEDLCIHRGARLSKGFIENDKVICPYHGWNYDGSSQCVLMPAAPNEKPMKKARAIAHHVAEKYGFVWVCLGTPANDIPPFPEWEDAEYKKIICGPYKFKSGYRAIENFLDATHFPFVHAGVNGSRAEPDPISAYDVEETEAGLSTSEIRLFQPSGDPRNVPVIAYYEYKCMRPLVAYFSKRVEIADKNSEIVGNPNDRFTTFATIQPIDAVNSVLRVSCAMNFHPAPSDEDILARQNLVYTQDMDVVDSQRPERIPIDLRQELHHRTDLLGQKYRSWLVKLGVTYGTI